MKKLLVLSSVFIVMAGLLACGPDTQEQSPQAESNDAHGEFFRNLSTLCGETFIGASTFPDNPDHPLVDTELKTHVSECDDDMIRIELIRGGDYWHGAWVLERREDGLHLFHDHLGDVRTMEDLGETDFHGYGGYADNRGSATMQFFAADQVTAQIIPAASTNVWMMELDLESERFIYYLERDNEPRFRAELEKI